MPKVKTLQQVHNDLLAKYAAIKKKYSKSLKDQLSLIDECDNLRKRLDELTTKYINLLEKNKKK